MEIRPQGDIAVVVQLGNLYVAWTVENVSWNPDIATDIKNRAMDMVRESLKEASDYGLFTSDEQEASVTVMGEDEDDNG